MIIRDLERCTDAEWSVVSAHVQWETTDRPEGRIEYRIPLASGVLPALRPEAFLLAAIAPAAAAGESRVAVEAPVCGILQESLPSALAILKAWFPNRFPVGNLPRIESHGSVAAATPKATRAAAFYSGGVDSTHLLLANTQRYPTGHPSRVDMGVSVYGFDMGGRVGSDGHAPYTHLLTQAAPFLASLAIQSVPVHTNLRHLDDRPGFWGEVFVGFALASVAHVLADEVTCVVQASPGEPLCQTVQQPFGAHPSLISFTNSSYVMQSMPYVDVGRLQRLREISANELALRSLRVCFFADEKPVLNCGHCEKCVRTQLGLRASGIDPQPYFSGTTLSPALLDQTDLSSAGVRGIYVELQEALAARGETPLSLAVGRQLARLDRYLKWKAGRTWGGRLRRLLRR